MRPDAGTQFETGSNAGADQPTSNLRKAFEGASEKEREVRNDTGDKEVLHEVAYPFGDRQRAEIDQQFTYHPPQPNQLPRYEAIRQKARELAELYMTMTPPSREQSLAITNLQQSAFWANASIARNENNEKPSQM